MLTLMPGGYRPGESRRAVLCRVMRYSVGGGLTAAERAREQVRLAAAELIEAGPCKLSAARVRELEAVLDAGSSAGPIFQMGRSPSIDDCGLGSSRSRLAPT
jgi:hypothetical protein